MRDVRAKLLFCRSKHIAFLPFSLPSPSPLLKPRVVGGNNSLGKVIQIPESGKSLLVESEILGFGIRNSTQESVIPVTIGI